MLSAVLIFSEARAVQRHLERAMTGSTIQNFDLFKAALGNAGYLTQILANKEQFFTMLTERNFSHQELLDSIAIAGNQQVKSLLIIHLLSQKEYLHCLSGDSILNRLTVPENHLPSRLNALIHQLDLSLLTPALIKGLEPETAISILCSIPHFHQLTREQTEALLLRYPRPELITYWMNHCASMPNAQYTLAHLLKLAGSHIMDHLTKMEAQPKNALINNMIEHLDLFHYLPQRFLDSANQESHLILAIRFYLNGHYNKPYTNFINQLTQRLIDKDHPFSWQTVELLFMLNDKLAFKELTQKSAYLTNQFLRNHAREGNIHVFYQNTQIDIARMIQIVHLNRPVNQEVKIQNAIPIKPPNTIKPLESLAEHPFIVALNQQNKTINSFEYFLVHYKGNMELLSQLLHDYFTFYEQPSQATKGAQSMHHISFMLHRPEIDQSSKEAIFRCFLKHPSLIDEHISYHLFLFDARRVCNYFGEKNYPFLIKLCSHALKKLDPSRQQEQIHTAKTALLEAQMELKFSKEQGFFSRLVHRFKKCWFYGWTGFFKPNPPEFVIPNLSPRTIASYRIKSFCLPIKELDLSSLVNKIHLFPTQKQYEDLIAALNYYSLLAMPKDELITRQKVHHLFRQGLIEKQGNPSLYRWLKENQTPFVLNQFRLLELVLQKKPRAEADILINQIHLDSEEFHYIADELHSSMPELLVKDKPEVPKKTTPDLVKNTAKVFSTCVDHTALYAQNAWSWAERFAGGLFAQCDKAPEEDGFKVEHVKSFMTSSTNS